MKRKNLENEARVIGNQYRDIIRAYGVDCIYNKLNTAVFDNYKMVIDQNLILERAYGCRTTPDYECSAKMLTYMEVEQDIFQLQKYGLNPNTDVNFYFDATDFACALATKLGQYQEYNIDEVTFDCEVPDCNSDVTVIHDPYTGEVAASAYVSADVFPYQLGLGYAERFTCELLSGKLSVEIPEYEYDKDYQIVCDPYEHTDFEVEFPANPDLYRSLKHRYKNDDYLQPLIYLDYRVSHIAAGIDHLGQPVYKNILHGRIHGSILFYNLFKIGKYLDKIHPDVGDIVRIDFPDEENAEKYEITDCYDKSLQTDGISPLLHKYIWKCKARRYINNHDDLDVSEADQRLQEKLDVEAKIDEAAAKKISVYENKEDAAYGGYDGPEIVHDKEAKDISRQAKTHEILDADTAIDIYRFRAGSRIVTDGFDLYFMTYDGDAVKVTLSDRPMLVNQVYVESGLKYLKASADSLVFINLEGEVFRIVEDEEAQAAEIELCLTSLLDRSLETDQINTTEYNNFFVFKNCKTMLWATEEHLFCKLESNGKLYRIA